MITGSKRKSAKAGSSPRATGFPLAPLDVLAQATEPPSYRAARYAHGHRVSLIEAADVHGITKQAVSQAWARLYPGVAPPGKPGRPLSPDPRTHLIDTERGTLRASSAEIAAYRRAARARGLSVGAWLVEIAGGRRIGTARLRRLARAAAGMPEE